MARFHLACVTGEDYYTAIFKRVYTLIIEDVADMYYATLRFQDYTPSAYMKGGPDRNGTLFSNIAITPKVLENVNKFIATNALKFDDQLIQRSGCERRTASIDSIKNQLKSHLK